MSSILDQLDRDASRFTPHATSRNEILLSAALGLFGFPFLLTVAMFVPFLGQLASLLAIGLTLYWLKLRRSYLLLLAWISGIALFLTCAALFSYPLRYRMDAVLFFLLGGGLPVTLVYLIGVGMLIWKAVRPPGAPT